MRRAKRLGFSDEAVAQLTDRVGDDVRALRERWDIRPMIASIDKKLTTARVDGQITLYDFGVHGEGGQGVGLGRAARVGRPWR